MKIYVASSWRNAYQPWAVSFLRDLGHDVYDFRDKRISGFAWSELDDHWPEWSFHEYRSILLNHERPRQAFEADRRELEAADVVVLILPCGASAHLEAGYAIGQGKPCAIYVVETVNPELMYLFGDALLAGAPALQAWVERQAEMIAQAKEAAKGVKFTAEAEKAHLRDIRERFKHSFTTDRKHED